jgi:hypothetical protein
MTTDAECAAHITDKCRCQKCCPRRAASDMLAALRAVDDYFTKGLIDVLPITMVQAAIAKAEGREQEPYCPFCKTSHPGGDTCMGHHP